MALTFTRPVFSTGAPVIPAPWPLADCPATWGNMDVWAATTG